MRIGVVHTVASPCRCHETLERAILELGHEPVLADSEEVPLRAAELARCDLVFDQTDRFRGEGMLRPLVRQLLEARGVRCVGSDARACFVADDKAATKDRFARAAVPSPRGEVVASRGRRLELGWPRVVKPVHEHMSRGLALVHDEAEERRALEPLLAAGKPALVEEFVAGRELAVSIVGEEVLPVVEWPTSSEVLGFEAKRTGPAPALAALSVAAKASVSEKARAAFRALGLAQWARFDVRLDSRERAWFLEANTKPSLETGSPCLVAAAAIGLDETAFIERLIETAHAR